MNGLLLIDKPRGVTSFDVVRQVRRAFRTRKVGHAGTLDPLATGVLLVAVGEATRIVQFLMEGEKTYRAEMVLGVNTDTQDSEGRVLESRPVEGVDEESLRRAVKRFEGTITQVPPMYSALKMQGVPLYRLARQGVEVERKERTLRVSRLEVVDLCIPRVCLEIDCSKGTYVRTLCHDIGQALGVGGHMTSLRRTRNGAFTIDECIAPDNLVDLAAAGKGPGLLSTAEALRGFPQLEVSAEAAGRLGNGIPPEICGIEGPLSCGEGRTVTLLRCGALLAVARFAPGRTREKRGDFELLRVFNRPSAT